MFRNHSLEGYDVINSWAIPLGNLYTQTNAFQEAERIIEQYILIAENDKNDTLISSGVINLSLVYQSQGKYIEASRLLQSALKNTPENPNLWMNLASASYALGNGEAALKQSDRAFLLDRSMFNVFKLRSLVYTDKRDYKKAKVALFLGKFYLLWNDRCASISYFRSLALCACYRGDALNTVYL